MVMMEIYFLISTGGGDQKSGASMSLVEAAKEAKRNLKSHLFNWKVWRSFEGNIRYLNYCGK